jgi:hypothetical protein
LVPSFVENISTALTSPPGVVNSTFTASLA